MRSIRRLLLLFFVACCPAFSANTFVQGNSSTVALSGSPYSVAFTSNVTSGNLLVTTIRYGAPAAAFSNVTGTASHCDGTWTIFGPSSMTSSTADVKGAWAYSFATGTGACTVNWNGAADPGGVMSVAEFSGPTSIVGGATFGQGSTSSTVTTNNVLASAGDLVLGFFDSQNGTASVTPGAGFTVATSGTASGTTYTSITYNLSASAGSVTTSLTWNSGGQQGSLGGLGVFHNGAPCAGFAFGGTYTAVQCGQHTATSSGDTNIAPFSLNVTSGNALGIAYVSCGGVSCSSGAPLAMAFSDTLSGNAWTCPASATLATGNFTIGGCFICNTSTGATTVTRTSGGSAWTSTIVFEIHDSGGACNPLTLDAFGSTQTGSTTTPSTTTSASTTLANEPVISFVFALTTVTNYTGNTGGYTQLIADNNGALQARNGATTTTYSSSWSTTDSQAYQLMVFTLGPIHVSTGARHRSHIIISYHPHQHKSPWDDRKRKLEIVKI